jgi:hypothetical protein
MVNRSVKILACVTIGLALVASTEAQTPSPTAPPPSFTLSIETLPDSGIAVLRIGDHRFHSLSELETFIVTLPPHSHIIWALEADGAHPEWKPFLEAFPQLRDFCVSKGMTLTPEHPPDGER